MSGSPNKAPKRALACGCRRLCDGRHPGQHNHLTRDIKDRGVCPACDYYWERAEEANDD